MVTRRTRFNPDQPRVGDRIIALTQHLIGKPVQLSWELKKCNREAQRHREGHRTRQISLCLPLSVVAFPQLAAELSC
jgi:hypothetical protein